MLTEERVLKLLRDNIIPFIGFVDADGRVKQEVLDMSPESFLKYVSTVAYAPENALNAPMDDKLVQDILLTGGTAFLTEDEVLDITKVKTLGASLKHTIDLNGHTLTVIGPSAVNITSANGGTLTFKGEMHIKGPGKIVYDAACEGLFFASGSGAVLTLENVDIDCPKCRVASIHNGGRLYINGGTYKGGANVILGMDKTGTGEVVITDGYFSCGAYNNKYYVLNLFDGYPNTIKVQGGTFEGMNPAASGTEPAGQDDNFVAEGHNVEVIEQGGKTLYKVV